VAEIAKENEEEVENEASDGENEEEDLDLMGCDEHMADKD